MMRVHTVPESTVRAAGFAPNESILCDVFPDSSVDNLLNRAAAHVESRSKCIKGKLGLSTKSPNLSHLLFRQFRQVTVFAAYASATMTSLSHHVGRVVGLCSKKQVRWTYAEPHVTTMKDAHAIGNRTTEQFPSRTMGLEMLAASPTMSDHAVASTGSRSRPEPAPCVGALDVSPPSFDERATFLRHGNVYTINI